MFSPLAETEMADGSRVEREEDLWPALGAARLAMVGCGAGTVEEVMVAPAVRETVAPEAALADAYAEAFAAYRATYPAVKDLP